MENLRYQDLLSKCIQNGRPGGGYPKSSSVVQGKTGRLLENSTTGSREDTSGAAEGLVAESDSGNRMVARMAGTAMDKLRSPVISLPRTAGAAHMRGRDLGFLKPKVMVTRTPPSTFSFRSLLKGAISSSSGKPPTSVQKMAESGMLDAPKVEPQKDCVSGEKHRLSDDRSLAGERHDGVVSGRLTPQSPCDEKVFSVGGAAESLKGKGNSAPRVRDSGSGSVDDSGPHVSYSSLLQAQIGDDVDKVRTETPQKTTGASLVDVEPHSSPLNLQLQSAELEGEFLSIMDKTALLLPAIARRAIFPAADSLSIGEQIPDIHHSDKPSNAAAVVESWFADKASERDLSKSLRATAVPSSLGLTGVEEDVSGVEVVVERGNSLVADSMCTQKEILYVQLPEGDDTAFAGDELRSADILSERGAIDSSEAAVVPASTAPRRIDEHSLLAEVVGNQGSFVVADSVCTDEEMSDVQLFEELSRALAVDESQFSEKVLNRDAIESSEASAVSASSVPEKPDDDDARAMVAAERSTLDVVDSVSTYERIMDVPLSEEPSGTFGVEELRAADNALNRYVLGSSDAAAVPESFPFTRIEEAYLPAELEPASCVVDASRCGDENVSGVQVPEELSRDPALGKSLSAKTVSETNVIDSSEAAAAAVSLLPLQTEEDVSRVEGEDVSRVAGLMDTGEKTSDVFVSDEPSHALALDGLRSVGKVFIESSEGAGDSASAVHIITGEDVLMSEAVVEKEVGHCGDADTEQGKFPLGSFNPSDGQVLGGRVQCPSQCLVTVKDRLEGQADRVNAGAKLDPVFQASPKKMDVTGDSLGGTEFNGATDPGNSVDPAIQIISTDPDAISEGLRQVFLRDSDATISDSVESARGTGAELVAGKEVQSPLVSKSKDRHATHLDDFEDSHIRHLKGLEKPRTRHLDENEEQLYTSPLNGTVHDELVGVEVHPYKKKGRPRAYNQEKSIRGTGRSQFHPSESKQKSQLQNAGNRCRRNRHVYPDQSVPVFIEGRDEVIDLKGRSPDFYLTADDYKRRETTPSCGPFSPQVFEDADGGSFLRWVAHQNEPNAAPFPALGKRVRKHGQELVKSIIAVPSFRIVSDYEEKQQEVEKRRKLGIEQQLIFSSRPTFVSSSTVQPSEYDMDDEDERWLHTWNKRLTRGGLKQPISEDKFEEMIEYFEKSAEMVVFVAGNFSGFSHYGKSLAQPLSGGALHRTCPPGLGLLNTNPATSGTPVSGNSPTLNKPAVRPEHPPWAGALKGVLNSRRQAMMSSSILVDRIGRNSASPASTVRLHTLISENERNISNSVVEAVCERPSEGLLRKPLETSALEKFSDDCCICNGGEDEENNPVYTCKRCLIHVHQSCYGIREKFRDDEGRVIAPSNWCCRKCEAVAVGRAQPNVSCALCRKRGGALKPTVVARKWAHVACALYTNETFFVDPDAMEPIDGIAAVAARAQERHDRCGLCGVKKGVCSLCAVKDCRAPFHISCGVSQGASFELRQSKQKVVGVRSFCPRHARTTAMDSVPSAELKDRHMLSSSSTSGATASATANGSISTASSMDDREEGTSRQSVSHPDGSFEEPAGRAENVDTHVADFADNIMSVSGKCVEDAGTVRPKGIRFTLKRGWDESCDQASEDGLSSDRQKKCGDGTGVNGRKVEALGWKSTWHVVEPGQQLRKIKFKFGRLAKNLNSESSPTLVQQEMIDSDVPQAEKMKDVTPALAEMRGDVDVNERELELVKGLSEDIFAKEVKELMILEEAMKSGVAPGHIMREAFVYWRAKRAELKGPLLNELHHEQWLRSQGIFNKDASDEERVATGKLASSLRIPQAQQLSPMSNEKALEMVKDIRMQLERVRLMAQMVVQREKLKYNHQLVVGTIASAELIKARGVLEEGHCVWCPSTRTLLKCGTCLRSFCFNCFKHRKGFGVKGWMAAMKQPMYICKYCRELSTELADLSINLDSAPKEIGGGGAACTQVETSRPAIGVVSSTAVISSEPVLGVVSTSVTSSKHLCEDRGNGIANGRGKGKSWHSTGSGSLRKAEGAVMAAVSMSVDATEDREKGLGIGRGKGNSWTVSENARRGSSRRGSEDGSRNQSKPCQLEDGLNKFLSSAHSQMEHSSFETTLRRLKILGCTNTDAHQDVIKSSHEIPCGDIVLGPGMDGMESVTPSITIGGNFSVSSSPGSGSGSGPALLVYKKRRLILGASSESPPSAYDFGDQPCSSTGLENGTSVYRITSPRRLRNEDGAAND